MRNREYNQLQAQITRLVGLAALHFTTPDNASIAYKAHKLIGESFQ